MKIEAKVIADSKNEFGNRITTLVCTFPRFILAELNTHRIMSKNSASSRAIPFNKMVESVRTNPFIPIAFQEEHKGMQGTKYLEGTDAMAAEHSWKIAIEYAIQRAEELTYLGVTKQLANRLLEPFMWHTVIITATEWDNFFELRCPQYDISHLTEAGKLFKSRKDAFNYSNNKLVYKNLPTHEEVIPWLKLNKGQAEIHMMALAEAIYDAINESTPELLKAGQWHIPYKEKIHEQFCTTNTTCTGQNMIPDVALISSIMCARVSYTVPGHDLTKWTYKKYIDKAWELANAKPFHASPFEHCAETMSNIKHKNYARRLPPKNGKDLDNIEYGWCRNFRGFVQLRAILEEKLN